MAQFLIFICPVRLLLLYTRRRRRRYHRERDLRRGLGQPRLVSESSRGRQNKTCARFFVDRALKIDPMN